MEVKVREETLPGTCGVSLFYAFNDDWAAENIPNIIPGGGTGIVCAGFRHKNEVDDMVFEEMCKHGKLLFKTRVRMNRNSGNKFYFAVFDYANGGKGKYGYDDQDREEERRAYLDE